MTRVIENGARFYVWQEGWHVRSAWRIVPPENVNGLHDCTGMSDGEFDELMEELHSQERANTSPGGDPGDPGRF